MVVAVSAVFIALGGGAYAASSLPANSVGSKQLKKHSVGSSHLKKHAVDNAALSVEAVTPRTVKKHSLIANDFKNGELPA